VNESTFVALQPNEDSDMSSSHSVAGMAFGIALLLSATSVPVVRAREAGPQGPYPSTNSRVIHVATLESLRRTTELQREEVRRLRQEVTGIAGTLAENPSCAVGRVPTSGISGGSLVPHPGQETTRNATR
jgi:hypothetical protein